jgi:hypothetical protein
MSQFSYSVKPSLIAIVGRGRDNKIASGRSVGSALGNASLANAGWRKAREVSLTPQKLPNPHPGRPSLSYHIEIVGAP